MDALENIRECCVYAQLAIRRPLQLIAIFKITVHTRFRLVLQSTHGIDFNVRVDPPILFVSLSRENIKSKEIGLIHLDGGQE